MIVEFILAALVGIATKNFVVFVVLIVLARVLIRIRPDLPLSSGLFKPGLLAIGISTVVLARVAWVLLTLALWAIGIAALSSLLGGDCDCDL
ncbi:MAG: hypothetical protein HZT41_13865 [Dechloromonas sp.]|nr:MAG: hypothetical protein HZT41_13865 [Dechloromonas sp.]